MDVGRRRGWHKRRRRTSFAFCCLGIIAFLIAINRLVLVYIGRDSYSVLTTNHPGLTIGLPSDFSQSAASLCHRAKESSSLLAQEQFDTLPVFYNLFLGDEKERPRVKNLVVEQLSVLDPRKYNPVYMKTLGRKWNISDIATAVHHSQSASKNQQRNHQLQIQLLNHNKYGDEIKTLIPLWSFCRNNTKKSVLYLHSKGSFHARPENELFRQRVTSAASSDACYFRKRELCNMCGMRFTPFPHAHHPGNMFVADCAYVQHLMHPGKFVNAMRSFLYEKATANSKHCYGVDRFAAEHWINSHPHARPCDVEPSPHYTFGYPHLNTTKKKYDCDDLRLAPRFDSLWDYRVDNECDIDSGQGRILQERLDEYYHLYGNEATPPKSWWGWKLKGFVDARNFSMHFQRR